MNNFIVSNRKPTAKKGETFQTMDSPGQHIDVTGPLHEVVKYFYCIQTSPDFQTINQHLAPNLEMMLVFNFGDPVRMSLADGDFRALQLERVGVLGPLRKMLNYEVLPNSDMIIAVFNPNGFYRLFQLPVNEIGTEEIMDPDQLLNVSGFQELWAALKEIPRLSNRLQLLNEFGLAFLNDAEEATAPLFEGIPYFSNPTIQPVRAIALDSDLSERTVQLRFKKYMGFSPKELLRFLRFKQVIGNIREQENVEIDWYELLEKFGYHDQSHLIKDFKLYLGTTPKKFVKEILGKEFCMSRPGKYDV